MGPGRSVGAGVLLVLALGLLAPPAEGQETVGYVDWLNRRIDDAVAARLNQRGISKQVEAPSLAASSTTLVDHASFADVLGVAFNPPTFPRANAGEPEASSQTFSLTPYAVLSAVAGVSPDDPFFYEEKRLWRSVAVNLGFEDEEADAAGGEDATGRTLVAGLKVKVWNPREVDRGDPGLVRLRSRLGVAAGEVAGLTRSVRDTLFFRLAEPLGIDTASASAKVAFVSRLGNAGVFQSYLALLGEEGRRVVLEMIDEHVDAVVALREQARELVAELRGEPQLSLQVQSRTRDMGRDEVRVGLAFDLGLTSRLHWTLNGGATFVGGAGPGESGEGANLATEISFQLRPGTLEGPDPIRLGMALEGELFDGAKPVWNLQGRLVIPLVEGISLPVTAIWSNRPVLVDGDELVDGGDLLGRLGLAVDTSRLLLAMSGR